MKRKIYRANVTIGVDVKILEYADTLVQQGIFASRSQAFEAFGNAYMEANNEMSEMRSGHGDSKNREDENGLSLPGLRVPESRGA